MPSCSKPLPEPMLPLFMASPGHDRLKNSIYSRKKEKMVSEHSDSTLLEMKLFHGTSVDAVSGISESGFDWRLSGSHGAMYGEGEAPSHYLN